jgi:hypothetical protein
MAILNILSLYLLNLTLADLHLQEPAAVKVEWPYLAQSSNQIQHSQIEQKRHSSLSPLFSFLASYIRRAGTTIGSAGYIADECSGKRNSPNNDVLRQKKAIYAPLQNKNLQNQPSSERMEA